MNELPFLVTQIKNLHLGGVPLSATSTSVVSLAPIAFHSDFRTNAQVQHAPLHV